MLRLIKLHLGLFKFLFTEGKKKRTPKQFIKFIVQIIKSYFKALINEFKHLLKLFDKHYRLEIGRNKQINQVKKDLQRALKMLQIIDKKMKKAGVSRQARRQFWRDFHKHGSVRTEMFNQLLKEVENG